MPAETFPYFTALHVNDCYTYRDFDIPIGEGDDKPFRHLILTGRNGSGKTTILREIAQWVLPNNTRALGLGYSQIPSNIRHGNTQSNKIRPTLLNSKNSLKSFIILQGLFTFFNSQRRTNLGQVSTVISDKEFEKQISQKGLHFLLKQFLVNKKVNQAFAIIEKNGKVVEEQDKFFDNLEIVLGEAFGDSNLKLVFVREEFEFYLQLIDSRRITFNQLSDGFSAFLGVILELLVRVELIQTRQKDFTLDPPGIVLIDEPETHLHLEMQYQVMPLLTRLFPNIQFIVATHSPAVASSIKNATVFDLTTKEVAKDWVVGSSFSELMQVHFGLDNEFSNIADDIMAASQKIVDGSKKPEEKLTALKNLFKENERYLSPAFHLALESQILRLEKALKPA